MIGQPTTSKRVSMSDSHQGINKIERYGWTLRDSPGELRFVPKKLLSTDSSYQRDVIESKVTAISASWSHLACGALVVVRRSNGDLVVVDGGHRLQAANRRSDIDNLPCVIFDIEGIKREARGFLDVNTNRKNVTAIAKHKAAVAAGDEVAIFVASSCADLGLRIIKPASAVGDIAAIAWCMKRAGENRSSYLRVLRMCAELCRSDVSNINETLLDGLWILNERCGDGLADERLSNALLARGATALMVGARKAAVLYSGKGGAKVWAYGMLNELNRGTRKKFSMIEVAE